MAVHLIVDVRNLEMVLGAARAKDLMESMVDEERWEDVENVWLKRSLL